MGSGKMGKCYNGEIHLDTGIKKLLNKRVPLKTTFQYSIIPFFHV